MPHGIGELTLLQSLPLFVVGEERELSRDHILIELKRLNQLRGGLRIKNLQNARVSEGEILKDKECLESLRLEWNGCRPRPKKVTVMWMMRMFKMPNSTTLFSTPSGGHERGFINNKCRILPSSSIPQTQQDAEVEGIVEDGFRSRARSLISSSF
ncbi:hypothetical protein AAG906_010094 [Vitis piasezkii]